MERDPSIEIRVKINMLARLDPISNPRLTELCRLECLELIDKVESKKTHQITDEPSDGKEA